MSGCAVVVLVEAFPRESSFSYGVPSFLLPPLARQTNTALFAFFFSLARTLARSNWEHNAGGSLWNLNCGGGVGLSGKSWWEKGRWRSDLDNVVLSRGIILSFRGGRWGGDELESSGAGILVGGRWSSSGIRVSGCSGCLAGRWLVGSVRSVAVGGRVVCLQSCLQSAPCTLQAVVHLLTYWRKRSAGRRVKPPLSPQHSLSG